MCGIVCGCERVPWDYGSLVDCGPSLKVLCPHSPIVSSSHRLTERISCAPRYLPKRSNNSNRVTRVTGVCVVCYAVTNE